MAPLSLENSTSSGERDENRNYSELQIVTELLCGCVKGRLAGVALGKRADSQQPGKGLGSKLGC